ncbi:hypothetical protein ABK040_000751 [Willaertia magna]
MKVLLLAVFLSLICSAFAQMQHCFDKSFSTGIRSVETKKNFLDETMMFVNADLQQMRFDIKQYTFDNNTNVSVYIDYKAKKKYVLFIQSGLCVVEPISMNFQPFCIAKNAVYFGFDVIGGILGADLYKERSLGFERRISYSPNSNVPVSVVTIGGNNVIIEDFINWNNQPPSVSLFTIPPECKNKKKSRDVVNTKSINEKINNILRRSL